MSDRWIGNAAKDFTIIWAVSDPAGPFVLPQAARVDWRKSPPYNVIGCGAWQMSGDDRLVALCRRVCGHTGRHADIAENGVVRKVWGP